LRKVENHTIDLKVPIPRVLFADIGASLRSAFLPVLAIV
jgi:hypothetical protein